MLTGVRGIGKTTTARIIARALNCIGADGKGGPTIEPCGTCEHCTSIAEDRHVDVIEMDAASHNKVEGIRDLTDGVRYRPVSARFKIYILDEVHMLTPQAFNALLKTLEEPPEHVKFIFATTEIRKVPVTVLSRCQRFDLRRVSAEQLTEHFRAIAKQESVSVDDEALAAIARAADGSVRDGLSLLDQAMALGGDAVTGGQVRDMLGLADRTHVFDLFDAVMTGEVAAALDLFTTMYRDGADPLVVVQDLMDLTYWLTRVSIAPEIADSPAVPEAERERGRRMAETLPMPALGRAWQILLKGLGEVQMAPAPLQAAEMLLVRLAYAAELPSPADLVRELHEGGAESVPAVTKPTAKPAPAAPSGGNGSPQASAAAQSLPEPEVDPAPAAEPRADISGLPAPQSFAELVALVEKRREAGLNTHLRHNVHLVHFEPGRLEFRPGAHAPRDLANKLGALLGEWTGRRWVVSISGEDGAPTLAEQAAGAARREQEQAARHPLVQAAQKAFPGAEITRVGPSPRAVKSPGDVD
jgi:DNA polymerase-3 subunit gamma/tau